MQLARPMAVSERHPRRPALCKFANLRCVIVSCADNFAQLPCVQTAVLPPRFIQETKPMDASTAVKAPTVKLLIGGQFVES